MPNELENKRCGFIGSGRISSVLVERLIEASALTPGQVVASDIDPEATRKLADRLEIRAASSNPEVVEGSDIVVLAVPPKEVLPVLREIKGFLRSDQLIISLAAAVPTMAMEEALERELPVVRVIPNIPSLVGAGTNPFCLGRHVGEPELRTVECLLAFLGGTEKIEEADMPVVTALTGMGPTYVLPVLQALADSAVESGFDGDLAIDLVARTFQGTAALVLETRRTPRELRKLIPAATGHDSSVAAIYSDTLTKIIGSLRMKEGIIHAPVGAVSSD